MRKQKIRMTQKRKYNKFIGEGINIFARAFHRMRNDITLATILPQAGRQKTTI